MQQECTHELTRLADKEADIVSEDGRVAIEEIAGHVNHHRQFSQFFKKLPSLISTQKCHKIHFNRGPLLCLAVAVQNKLNNTTA